MYHSRCVPVWWVDQAESIIKAADGHATCMKAGARYDSIHGLLVAMYEGIEVGFAPTHSCMSSRIACRQCFFSFSLR